MSSRLTLLIDNGSLAPAAALRLRELAHGLGQALGERVDPVSLAHSDQIPAEALGGVAAEILPAALARCQAGGATELVLLPLFFGPSRALTASLPKQLRRAGGEWTVRQAPPLFADGDDRLARILADQIRAAAGNVTTPWRVALVDHGSPVQEVTAVRDALARQVRVLLGDASVVAPCSMERRDGEEYGFNEPLLETLLSAPGWNESGVIVAMQFLLPGRHAGPDGDVAGICAGVRQRHPLLSTRLTPLVAEHPLLLEILADRWRAAGVITIPG